ncbi:MAG: hypothetical protein ISS25_02135 [Nanoarchaeota archaeon]|nr:hypothetical protein [DPANN group archaeon]MBL7116605.1 hypothetical protein [Nanoarchaeota archaeon]
MTFVEIKRIFEKRKYNLIRTLESGREEIDLSKQHQIYGAIKELENIMKTLDYYQEMEVKNQFDFRLSNEPNKTLLQKITLKLKNKKPEAETTLTVNE